MVANEPETNALPVIMARGLRAIVNDIEQLIGAGYAAAEPKPAVGPKLVTRESTERRRTIIALCGRPEGATRNELSSATGSPRSKPWKLYVERSQKYSQLLRISSRNGQVCYHLRPNPASSPS